MKNHMPTHGFKELFIPSLGRWPVGAAEPVEGFLVMARRKSITKKTRFEVFKRDNFTCQYCGRKAPDAVLEIDHVVPVSKGGDNSILNLVTACWDCNSGKSDRVISDASALSKQLKQLEQLHARREQVEMLAKYKKELTEIENTEVSLVVDLINQKIAPQTVSQHGFELIRKSIKKFGASEVIEAIPISFDRYYNGTQESISNAFDKINGICFLRKAPEHVKKISFIKAACRSRFSYFNERLGSALLNEFHEYNGDLDQLLEMCQAYEFTSFSQFRRAIEKYISDKQKELSKVFENDNFPF